MAGAGVRKETSAVNRNVRHAEQLLGVSHPARRPFRASHLREAQRVSDRTTPRQPRSIAPVASAYLQRHPHHKRHVSLLCRARAVRTGAFGGRRGGVEGRGEGREGAARAGDDAVGRGRHEPGGRDTEQQRRHVVYVGCCRWSRKLGAGWSRKNEAKSRKGNVTSAGLAGAKLGPRPAVELWRLLDRRHSDSAFFIFA